MRKQTKNNNIIKLFRLTLSDGQTHQILKTFHFSRIGMIWTAVSAVVLSVVLIYCLIAFTPIKTTIPGYPDAHSRKQALAGAIKVDSLESIITRWELYAENLSRVLSGEETISIDSIITGSAVKYLSAKSREELERQDSIMRYEIDSKDKSEGDQKQKSATLEGMHIFNPYNGVVINGFNAVSNPGLDISASDNSAVCAALEGTVICVVWNEASGYTLVLQHKGEASSVYSRCEKVLRNVGDKVSAGTPLGLVAPGDFLHFELWYKGTPEDPCKYLSIQ